MKIKKYQVIGILEILKDYGCNTIDEAINKIKKEIPNDTDIAFTFTSGSKEDIKIKIENKGE